LLKIKSADFCSAVVIASQGGNSIMRKLYALEKIFSEKQENER